MKTIWLNDWNFEGDNNLSLKQLISDFDITEQTLEGINILFATYEYVDYNGDAFVLFEKDGKLYEVNGGHCSCYGLEGQWEPEEILLDELIQRVSIHYDYDNCRTELYPYLLKLKEEI